MRYYHPKISCWLIITTILLLGFTNNCQALTAKLVLSPEEIALGETTQLTLSVTGANNARPQIEEPAGLKFYQQGSSTRINVINGRFSASSVYTYQITGNQVGQYQLGPFQVTAGGKTCTTNVVTLQVTKNSTKLPTNIPDNNSSNNTNPAPLFLKLQLESTRFYVKEAIPLKVYLYIREDTQVENNINYPKIKLPSFAVHKAGKVTTKEVLVQGVAYTVVEFPYLVSTYKDGEFALGPFELSCNLLLGGRTGTLLDEFWPSYEKKRVTLKSNPVTVTVLPLPKAGKPQNFSGGVGQFQLDTSASSQKPILQGDPLSIKIVVSGKGNFDSINAPSLKNTGNLKVYPAERKQIAGDNKVVFEQVVIPLDPKITKIGPYYFSYFDTNTQTYQILKSNNIKISIKPDPHFPKQGTSQNNENQATVDVLGKDILFIKETPGNLKLKSDYIYHQFWFWLINLIPLLILLGLLVYQHYQKLMTSDTSWSRTTRANQNAQRKLSSVKKLLKEEHYAQIPEELQRIVKEFLGEKYKLKAAGITGSVITKLEKEQLDKELLTLIKQFFERYDYYSFTGSQVTATTATELFQLAEKILTSKK